MEDARTPSRYVTLNVSSSEVLFQDVQMSEDGKYLIAISDDGTVSAYNCKRHMFLMESESMGTDLCSIATVKGETKTLVTTSSGQIQIYNYKGWGHPSDIIPGHGFPKIKNSSIFEKLVGNF